ncbi:MAG TPA: plasmid mobilization relaxosome protein MobC [Caproicibacter sp.]|nr:plasmid mobilization relaxosome protein MobC [Caproicibacter sp.]
MRTRNVQEKFFLTAKEVEFLNKKMQVAGIKNKSAYLRKMALGGYIIHMDFSELQELINAFNRIGNNLNQIAKVANTYGEVSMPKVNEFWAETNRIFFKLDKVIDQWRVKL